jgi:hypothetical protein
MDSGIPPLSLGLYSSVKITQEESPVEPTPSHDVDEMGSMDPPNNDERVFDDLLIRKLRFTTDSLLFLEKQNVTTIQHLCVVGIEETQRWRQDKKMTPVHVALLNALIDHVQRCRSRNKGILPPDWSKTISLDSISAQLLPAPQAATASTQLVWLKIQCASIPSYLNDDYSQ